MRSNGKREKWIKEFYLKYSTATSRAKRKLQKIRERNTKKKKRGDQKQRKKAGILSKKKGTQEKLKRGRSYKNLRKPELLTCGLQATHELGGLNVEV